MNTQARRSIRSCPICGKARSETHSPFCSTRCKDRDLVQWLQGGYAILGEPAEVPTGNDDEKY